MVSSDVVRLLDLDRQTVERFYSEYLSTVSADVNLLVADGELSSVTISADLSDLYQHLFSDESDFDLGVPSDDLAAARSGLADTKWTVTLRTEFDVDADVPVPPPPKPNDDRTDAAVEFIERIQELLATQGE